jgi:glycine cleavage system regulatory protein
MRAQDRDGLLRDVTELLAGLGVPLRGNTGRLDPFTGQALLSLEVRLGTLRELAVLVERLGCLPGVLGVRVQRR